ncbi:peptide chain release factor 2 [Enterobacterales bacterium endosymbiont of Anomoneura mori]|uniref:peptide chain release factor 2 n=1 Tax=Enterobacterales bacterium endosymbiont of Anomoneura mori TaxID=3132096 RepID=UPI00399C8A5F
MNKKKILKEKNEKILKYLINIKKKINYKKKKIRLEEINYKLKNPDFWSNNLFLELKEEFILIKNIFKKINFLKDNIFNNFKLLKIFEKTKDEKIFDVIKNNLNYLKKKINNLEEKCFFLGKNDKLNCFINIKAGSGGIDSQNWCNILFKMYLNWAEKKNFKIKFIEKKINNNIGIKSITMKIIGNNAYGWLRTETGIHRLVRKNPFNNNKRHTSFSSVYVYPEINDNININYNYSDLRIDLYRSSGAGGQHINKTESAVRIKHLPTNIYVQCQNSRSQHKNKKNALKKLNLKLLNLEFLKKKNIKKKIEDNKKNISWSNQIRSYILDNSIIKDIRTNYQINNVKNITNINLDLFIKASLKAGL